MSEVVSGSLGAHERIGLSCFGFSEVQNEDHMAMGKEP